MRRISVKEAAKMMQASEQCVRELIKADRIAGASCYGSEKHRTYYITDEQVLSMTRGTNGNVGVIHNYSKRI